MKAITETSFIGHKSAIQKEALMVLMNTNAGYLCSWCQLDDAEKLAQINKIDTGEDVGGIQDTAATSKIGAVKLLLVHILPGFLLYRHLKNL